jgi:hypothetical protein
MMAARKRPQRVMGGCHPEINGTAGLHSAPEMPCVPRQLIPDIYCRRLAMIMKKSRLRIEFVKQRLCLFQIGRIQALCEPAINRGKQVMRLLRHSQVAPHPSDPGRQTQF